MPIATPYRLLILLMGLPALVAHAAAAGPGNAQGAVLDPTRVGWTEISMSASKLFITATASLSVAQLPREEVTGELIPAGQGRPVPVADPVLRLGYEAGGFGRRSQTTLYMDPRSGAALQNTQYDLEGRLRVRTYRFTETGAWQQTRRPAAGEDGLPPAKWTKASQGFRPYPEDDLGHTVLHATGLLYAVAAAPLDRPGDHAEFWLFSRRDLQRVRVEVAAPRTIDVDYKDQGTTETVRRKGTVQPLRLMLRGEAEPGADEEQLELFGLRGQLELSLDPVTRTPLRLTGDVPIIGSVTLRLVSVVRR